jgi:hypothetical protein
VRVPTDACVMTGAEAMAATYGQYHVITPITSQWVETRAEVRAAIDDYMQADGASIARVSVLYVPPRAEPARAGQPLSAAGFWP